jgi:hypothetical protein
MTDRDEKHTALAAAQVHEALCEKDRLFDRYGADIADDPLDEDAKKDLLAALWRIMQSMVDLGFTIGRGEKFTRHSEIGMDDVLDWLLIEDTAHETDAPDATQREQS